MLKKKLKTICIAHSNDVDGVSSATLTKMATGAESYLVNYDRLIDVLKNIDGKSEVIVCDLGMNNRTINEFINQAERICKEGKFTYIDHHPLSSYSKKRIVCDVIGDFSENISISNKSTNIEIELNMKKYQKFVYDNIYNFLINKEQLLCNEDSAINTMEVIDKINNY